MKAPLICALCLMPALATAHPHVFVDAEVVFLGSPSALDEIRVTWRYDEFTTLFLIETLDLDRDGDGVLDAEDEARIVAGETDWPPEYEGDIYMHAGGQHVAMTRPHNADAGMVDGRIFVTFDLPLATPQPLTPGAQISLKLYDPYYYYDYDILPGAMIDPAAPGCAVTLVPFAPDREDAALQEGLRLLARDEVPAEENIGARFADELVVHCD